VFDIDQKPAVYGHPVVGQASEHVVDSAGDPVRHGHGLGTAGAEQRHPRADCRQQRAVAFEVAGDGPREVGKRDDLPVIDERLHGHEGVDHVGQPDAGGAGAVVPGAPPVTSRPFGMQSLMSDDSNGVGRKT